MTHCIAFSSALPARSMPRYACGAKQALCNVRSHVHRFQPRLASTTVTAMTINSTNNDSADEKLQKTNETPTSKETDNEKGEIVAYSGPFGWLKQLMANGDRIKASTLSKFGVAAFISYGLFDALTYSISFFLSLKAFIAAGKVVTWETLPQVLAVMWGINNFSRPFRLAGAVLLAPLVDRRVVKPVSSFISRLRQKS